MSAERVFIDTNILLYLLSGDSAKAGRAEALLEQGGVISVQVLNEFSSVATRKLGMGWTEVRDVLQVLRAVCEVQPLTINVHERGLELAERYQLPVYDAMIAASAALAECGILYSEDFQNGMRMMDGLKIENPFV